MKNVVAAWNTIYCGFMRSSFRVSDSASIVTGGTLLTFTLDQEFGGKHAIGRLRHSVTASRKPVRAGALPEDVAKALRTPPEKRTAADLLAIHRRYLAGDPEMAGKIRLRAVQDLAWALLDSPAFLFNR